MESMTITEFLEARIAEEDAAARAATSAPLPYDYREKTAGPVWQGSDYGMVIGDYELWDCEGSSTLCMNPSVAAHVALHDPRRVLDECKSKRALIALAKEIPAPHATEQILERMAVAYADHHEYGAWTNQP